MTSDDTRARIAQIGEHELLTVKQAAEYLTMGEAHCWKLVRERTIPSRRVGRRVLITRADLVAYFESLPNAYDNA